MRAVACLFLGALTACSSDPNHECYPGTSRDPGPACTSPPITAVLDGVPGEWSDPRYLVTAECGECEPLPCRACAGGDVLGVQVARDESIALVLYLDTGAPPLDAPMTYYGVTVSGNRSLDLLVRRDEVRVFQEGFELFGLADRIAFAFGPTGVELRIPIDLLPAGGGADVAAEVWEPNQFGSLLPRHLADFSFTFLPSVDVCWDASRPSGCENTDEPL